jgi:hypothetical protein
MNVLILSHKSNRSSYIKLECPNVLIIHLSQRTLSRNVLIRSHTTLCTNVLILSQGTLSVNALVLSRKYMKWALVFRRGRAKLNSSRTSAEKKGNIFIQQVQISATICITFSCKGLRYFCYITMKNDDWPSLKSIYGYNKMYGPRELYFLGNRHLRVWRQVSCPSLSSRYRYCCSVFYETRGVVCYYNW